MDYIAFTAAGLRLAMTNHLTFPTSAQTTRPIKSMTILKHSQIYKGQGVSRLLRVIIQLLFYSVIRYSPCLTRK